MYLLIDTWNGEGYSYNNGADVRLFESLFEAIKAASNLAMENAEDAFDTNDEGFEFITNTNLDAEDGEFIHRAIFSDGLDAGSYQVFEVNDNIVAAQIYINYNEVLLVREDELSGLIEDNNEIALEGPSKSWWETDEGEFKMVYLNDVPRKVNETDLEPIETAGNFETELYTNKVDGKLYRVPCEIVRDFNNAKPVTNG